MSGIRLTAWIYPTGESYARDAICEACRRQVKRAIVDGYRYCPMCGLPVNDITNHMKDAQKICFDMLDQGKENKHERLDKGGEGR